MQFSDNEIRFVYKVLDQLQLPLSEFDRRDHIAVVLREKCKNYLLNNLKEVPDEKEESKKPSK